MYPCLGLLLVEWYVAPGGLFQVLSVVLHVVDLEKEKRESQARVPGTRIKGESHKNTWNKKNELKPLLAGPFCIDRVQCCLAVSYLAL
jgi:hypothetical protein